jgi:type II restriction/modification system DNA methylase subunit YeeA
VLRKLDNITCDDSILRFDEGGKAYEPEWPTADFIVGNPPFLGDKLMKSQLGSDYVKALRGLYGERLPGQSDLCCYWLEKARAQIAAGKSRRAGLLATQGIRGGANREVLKRIKESGDIFFAVSDREWALDGANVHISIIGFDNGDDRSRLLDGQAVPQITPSLTSLADLSTARPLRENAEIAFIGTSMHGPFDFDEEAGLQMLMPAGNPTGKPNSDVVRPILNALEITRREARRWTVAFDPAMAWTVAAGYHRAAEFVKATVKPVRDENHRKAYRDRWWLHGEARPAMQAALRGLPRFLATPRVSKHRVFVWVSPEILPSDATVAFARHDDFFFGVLQSRFHEVWALKLGTRLETRPRYTPTTCFETFPLPPATAAQTAAIESVAIELYALRDRWLNPTEWMHQQTVEFPGSAEGPWARYIDTATVVANTGLGLVRYPRLEPKDASSAKMLKVRTLTKLYNERPTWLDNAHKALDAAVAAAYGWPADLTNDQVIERLLAMNLQQSK